MSESVETAHGTVAYETATCVSCGEEFNKEDMANVVIGEMTEHRSYGSMADAFEFKNGYTTGRVCSYCRDDPASYPVPRVQVDHLPVIVFAYIIGIICGVTFTMGVLI